MSRYSNKATYRLLAIRNAFDNGTINKIAMQKSLNWIMQKANENLDKNSKHYWTTNARNWTISNNGFSAILENNDMNSASIEFGIGRIGGAYPKNRTINNENIQYEYDVATPYKDELGFWTFVDEYNNRITIAGYEGKSFLYNACMSYIQLNKWQEFYQEAYDEVMRGICK